MGARGELGRHHGVHLDHDLLLLGHEGVALLHLVHDPVFEGRADDHGADVDDPLLGHLRQVNAIREELFDFGLGAGEGEDLLDRQVLVLGHVEGLDVVHVDVGLLPGQDVLEKVNGDVI